MDQTVGMLSLGWQAFRLLLNPPWDWVREFLLQCAFLLRHCALPFAVSTVFISFAINVIAAGQVIRLLGAQDRIATFAGTGGMRELSFWVAGTMLAGIAGSAVCADLGARRTRDELDALSVLGVNVMKALVLPRILAIMLMAPLLNLWTDLFMVGVPYVLVPGFLGASQASFAAAFSDIVAIDLYAHLIKITACGLVIGIICTYKGLHTSGGPAGVAKSVNQAVLVAFVSTWVLNLLFNTFLLAAFPATEAVR
jgi:phospholipid/cholesterol/gamma-HCH transport system permease protein